MTSQCEASTNRSDSNQWKYLCRKESRVFLFCHEAPSTPSFSFFSVSPYLGGKIFLSLPRWQFMLRFSDFSSCSEQLNGGCWVLVEISISPSNLLNEMKSNTGAIEMKNSKFDALNCKQYSNSNDSNSKRFWALGFGIWKLFRNSVGSVFISSYLTM